MSRRRRKTKTMIMMKNDGNDDEGYSVPCDDRDNDNGRDEELTCYSKYTFALSLAEAVYTITGKPRV